MLAVRLEDGSTIFGFGTLSVVARNGAGHLDAYWQKSAEASVSGAGGDVYTGLMALPGAKVIHEGQIGAQGRNGK